MEANLYQIVAITLASFSVGMNVGRLLTLWQKESKERDSKSREGDY